MGDKPTFRMTRMRAAVLLNVWEHLQAEMSAMNCDATGPIRVGTLESVTRHLCYLTNVGALKRCARGIYTRGDRIREAVAAAEAFRSSR